MDVLADVGLLSILYLRCASRGADRADGGVCAGHFQFSI
mgnify:CR=1 FL=1